MNKFPLSLYRTIIPKEQLLIRWGLFLLKFTLNWEKQAKLSFIQYDIERGIGVLRKLIERRLGLHNDAGRTYVLGVRGGYPNMLWYKEQV